MRKLTLSLLLTLLPACWPKPPVEAPGLAKPCEIVQRPTIEYDPKVCGDMVCLAVMEAVAMATYITLTEERNDSLARCPYVKEVPHAP